jgi:hypothetical protein
VCPRGVYVDINKMDSQSSESININPWNQLYALKTTILNLSRAA